MSKLFPNFKLSRGGGGGVYGAPLPGPYATAINLYNTYYSLTH